MRERGDSLALPDQGWPTICRRTFCVCEANTSNSNQKKKRVQITLPYPGRGGATVEECVCMDPCLSLNGLNNLVRACSPPLRN